MRLVLVVPAFPKLSETFIVSKFLGLLACGWDVHVVCQRTDRQEWDAFPGLLRQADWQRRVHIIAPHQNGLLVALYFPLLLLRCFLRAPRVSWRYWRLGRRRFGRRVAQQFYLDAALIALQPDIVHFEFGALAAGRTYLKDLLDCQISVSFRGYDLNMVGLEQADYYQDVWRNAGGLHLLGKDLWARAQQRGCPADKFHVLIPPAIDVAFFKRQEVSNSQSPIPHRSAAARPLHILSVGRLHWKKGYEYALQAVRLLQEQGIYCDYRIIGGGDYLEGLTFARHEMGIEDQVSFLGTQTPVQVREQMRWADVFLHAATSEGFCNAVLEAQAMALPVVCSDADGLAENVVDGQTGFVVPRRDPAALAEKLRVLAADAELRKRLGNNGRERVENCFQLPTQIAAFDRFYRQLVECNDSSR